MNGILTQPSDRAISIIALVQSGVVVGGTLFVTVMLKLAGYKGGGVPDSFFNSGALFVRHYGLLLLLLPAAWAALALWISRNPMHRRTAAAVFLLGIAAALFGIYQFVSLGFHPGIL